MLRKIKVGVTCDNCKSRFILARALDRPQRLHLICHSCETALTVDVTLSDFKKPIPALDTSRIV